MAEQATLLEAPGAVGDQGALTGRDDKQRAAAPAAGASGAVGGRGALTGRGVERRAAAPSAEASAAVGDLLLLASWLRPATEEGSEAGSGLHAGSAADAVLAEAGSALAAGSAGTGLGSRSGAGSAVGLHSLGLGELRERLGVLGRVRSVLAAVEAELVSEITRRQGTTAAEEILSGTQRRSRGAARKAVRTAKDLQAAPKVADKLAAGKITPEAAGLITGAAGDTQVDQDYLLDAAGREPDDLFRRTVKRHVCERTKAEELAERRKRQYRRRAASIHEEPDGMWRLFAEFDPLAGSRIRGALYSAADGLFRREDPKRRATQQQRLADALEELICTPTPTAPNPTRSGQRQSTNNDNGHRSRGGDGHNNHDDEQGGGDRAIDGVDAPNADSGDGHNNRDDEQGGGAGEETAGCAGRSGGGDRAIDDQGGGDRAIDDQGGGDRAIDGVDAPNVGRGGDRSVVGGAQRPDGVLGLNGSGAAGHEVTGDNSPNGEGAKVVETLPDLLTGTQSGIGKPTTARTPAEARRATATTTAAATAVIGRLTELMLRTPTAATATTTAMMSRAAVPARRPPDVPAGPEPATAAAPVTAQTGTLEVSSTPMTVVVVAGEPGTVGAPAGVLAGVRVVAPRC